MYMKQKHMNLLKTALIAVSFIVYPLSYAQDEIGVAAAVNTKTIDMLAYPGGNIENIKVDPGYKIIQNRTIQSLDCLVGFRVVWHFHKAKPP